jgi:GrpB-like predicted nucleotidyltransferase (UPF0157 family)
METHEEKLARVLAEVVAIVPYDPAWPDLFRQEKERLQHLFPCPLVRRVEHFGSTAVPGLSAKPIIDMLIEVSDLTETRRVIAPVLEARGYDYFWRPTSGSNTPPFYAWFIRRDSHIGARTHHLHMVESHFTEHWDRLLFRDYLISHPAVAREYECLKYRLAAIHSNDRVLYAHEKAAFINAVTEAARSVVRGGA